MCFILSPGQASGYMTELLRWLLDGASQRFSGAQLSMDGVIFMLC